MKITKKILSVILAVVMLMSSMSVCFGTLAASGTVTNDQWNALYEALKADSVKNATFSTVNGKYTVDDPDGAVLTAVQAYFSVFNTLANKTPATGNPNNTNTNYTTGSSEGNRVIQQVNASIKDYVSKNMPGYEASMGTFISSILGTASVSTDTGSEQTVGGDTSNNKNLPTNNLSDVATINLTVVSSSAITGYTLDTLPNSVVTEKTFGVNHAKDRYDYKYATGSTGGCNSKTTYTRYYKYFYYISGNAVVTDGEAISTQVIKDSQAVLEANAAYFSYTLDQFVELGFEDVEAIKAIKEAVVDAKAAVVEAFSGSVYNHFFSAYNVEALSALVDKAVEIIAAAGIAMDLNDLVDAGYGSIITDKGALETLANNVKTLADKYDAYASDVKAYVESHEYNGETFVRADVTAFYNAIIREIELIELRALKATIEAESAEYLTYDEDKVTDGTVNEETGEIENSTVTGADLNIAIGTIQGWIDAIGTYDSANVAAVWGAIDIVATLSDLKSTLSALNTLAGHNESFAKKYSEYIKTVYEKTNIADDSADLLAAISGYDSWYSGLKALVAEIEAAYNTTIKDAIIEGHDAKMKDHLDSKYWALHDRVFAQIDLADKLYKELADDGTLSILNVDTYAEFEDALGHVEVDVYNFLYNSPNFDMPQLTIDEFNEIWSLILEEYHNFVTSGGFNKYEETANKTAIPDIVRPETEDDAHDAHIGDYTVTDEKVEGIIDLIDSLLNDADIKALLGDLINKDEDGNPTGEPFDLATLVTGLIEENVFSDSLINTIIGFIYPAVANIFTDVWMGIDPWIDDPAMDVMGQTVSVKAELYLKTVEEATAGLGLPIFPNDLAAAIRANYNQFSAVADVLDDATTKAFVAKGADGEFDESTRKSPWNDDALYTDKVDDEGNTTKVLNLNWGIDEREGAAKKERFLQAVQAALCGIEPILLALLCNTPMSRFNAEIGKGFGQDGLSGFSAGDIVIIQGIWEYKNTVLSDIELDIHTIDLRLEATANDGYNNVIAPLFELLGVTAPNGQDFKSTRDVIEKGLLEPLDAVIAKLAANPVTTLLEILPNLAYAIEMNMLLPKLNYLATNISYSAGATINADLNDCTCNHGLIATLLPYLDSVVSSMTGLTCTGGIIQNVRADDVMTDNLPVEIAGIINIEDLLGDIDLSSFAGIWEMVAGMLGEGVTLPKLDAGYLATLGKLTWKDTQRSEWTYTPLEAGKAAYIEANKADVLIFLLQYVFEVIGNPTAFDALIHALVTKEVQDTNEDGSDKYDENGKPVMIKIPDEEKIADLMKSLTEFGLFEIEGDKAIAAIVELLNGVEYDTLKEYVWYVSELNEDTVVGMTPAIQQYLGYDNNWTKTTATHLIENVDAIIAAVMAMVGGDEEATPAFDLSATLADLISGLFTNKNITALAKALSKLDLNALLADDKKAEELAEGDEEATEEAAIDINALVAKFAGIDLTGFAAYAELADDYNWGFEDGDKAGFKAALIDLLAPLSSVLDFILADADLALLDGDVVLKGYNGYDSAIVPLLEALGATPAALAEDADALEAVLDALLARVDAIVADPIDEILGLIPSLLYFVKSNGLTTAVRNLLQPVLVILETIDPIYALNLNELIDGLTKDLGFTLDLGNLGFEAIFDILGAVVALDLSELEEIIDDVCEVIAPVDYTSASSVIGANGKKGAYGKFFDAADLVTVLVSFALSWVQEGNNANDLVALIAGEDAEKAAEIQKYITGAIKVIGGIEPEYQQIDWDYNFPADYDDSIFESGLTIQPTINTIKYPTNWTEDAAKYIADNLDTIVNDVLAATGSKYATVSDLLKANVNIYSTENVDAIVETIAGLLADIDEVLLKTVGLVLGANLEALTAYKAPEGIDTAEEFAAALTEILATIQPVVNWLLFGEDYTFFSKAGTDLVTIKGAEGYAYGLAPILEALGVNAPAKDEATVANVLEATFARIDALLASKTLVTDILDLLPNIVYFLNANGISISVQNLLAGVTGLIGTVSEEFGVELDLIAIINDLVNGLLPEDTTVTLDVANLDLESIFALVQELLSLDLTPIADILVDLCVGNIVVYTSASGEYGFKMQYSDDFARYDMITIVVSCLLQIIKLDANKEALLEMLGEEAYEAVLNILSLDVNVPVQDFQWALTDSADTGEVFSALMSSELFGEFQYGPLYTEEMEQYISNNFGEFVDNIVYLLGLEINGTNVESLSELLNGLVGGSVYNSDIVITIRDAVAGLAGTLEESIPAGAHILEILKNANIADIKAVADVEVPEFKDDRAQFVAALCDVLEPLFPVLEWLLADADLTFFIDEAEETLITLPGAEGYAFGLIPVLEALDCDGILTRDEYNAAVAEDKAVLLTSILTPLLDRVDEILAKPADEILSILPNLIYFINSNGVDTVVKNTLNAVYTLLNAIEPIAKVDLYEIIGLDLATIDFDWLFDKAIELIAEATGYELTALHADAIVELSTGTLESYTSANGKTAYRMVYQAAEAKGEMVTVVLRLAVKFLALDKNVDAVMGILENSLGMSDEAKKYVEGTLKVIVECLSDTRLGIDMALATIYYIFFGVDTGVDETTGGYNDLNELWKESLDNLRKESPEAADIITGILDLDIFDNIIDPDKGIAPNGFIAFFQTLFSWFQNIINWFKNIFG